MRVALVLGAAVRPDGTPSPTLALRVDHAVALLREGRVDRLCLTGGRGRSGPSEASVARARALAAGVPPDAIILEDRSTDTVGNLALAFALLPPGADVTLVSNRWHLPRAFAIARALGHSVRLSGPRGQAPPATTFGYALREAAALPLSILRARRVR